MAFIKMRNRVGRMGFFWEWGQILISAFGNFSWMCLWDIQDNELDSELGNCRKHVCFVFCCIPCSLDGVYIFRDGDRFRLDGQIWNCSGYIASLIEIKEADEIVPLGRRGSNIATFREVCWRNWTGGAAQVWGKSGMYDLGKPIEEKSSKRRECLMVLIHLRD